MKTTEASWEWNICCRSSNSDEKQLRTCRMKTLPTARFMNPSNQITSLTGTSELLCNNDGAESIRRLHETLRLRQQLPTNLRFTSDWNTVRDLHSRLRSCFYCGKLYTLPAWDPLFTSQWAQTFSKLMWGWYSATKTPEKTLKTKKKIWKSCFYKTSLSESCIRFQSIVMITKAWYFTLVAAEIITTCTDLLHKAQCLKSMCDFNLSVWNIQHHFSCSDFLRLS